MGSTARSIIGCGLQRLISAHTIRETVVVALRDDVADQLEQWTAAYAAEPEWVCKTSPAGHSRNSPPS
ncbi:MAG TPA: hypothetical protein VGD71_14200 [Kribbella sp.]|jgi:hypothetical protein